MSAPRARPCAGLDVQVVLTMGHHALPRGLSPLPASFRHAPFLPGLDMAARSDLLVHHGGYGSCQTGLYAGTPAVILPTYSERESNARRVAAVGAGEFIVPGTAFLWRRTVAVEDVREKVRDALAGPSFRDNARRAGERLRAYGGAEEAAERIEELL
jgi:UDP:flavonoid glycosyltransferase YjiC (YdhE family)